LACRNNQLEGQTLKEEGFAPAKEKQRLQRSMIYTKGRKNKGKQNSQAGGVPTLQPPCFASLRQTDGSQAPSRARLWTQTCRPPAQQPGKFGLRHPPP